MPALLPAPGVIRFAIHQDLAGSPVVNVIHARFAPPGSGGVTQSELDGLCVDMVNAWTARLMPHLVAQMSLRQVTGQDLTADTGVASSASSAAVGGIAANPLPANCALVVSWPEALRYRGGHPRTYIAGLTAGQQIDPRHVSVEYAGEIRDALNQIKADMHTVVHGGVAGVEFGALHRVKDKVNRNPPLFTPFGPATANTRIDSQRRRLGKN